MKEHYCCQGICQGVSSKPGVCQTEGCEKYGQELRTCTCDEPEHQVEKEEPKEY